MTTDGNEDPAVCNRDGVVTRLRCANCGVPICPACMVRTEVGLRCPSCGSAPTRLRAERRRHVTVAGIVIAVALFGGGWALVSSQDSSPPLDDDDLAQPSIGSAPPFPPLPEVGQAPGPPVRVERRDLGFSLVVPSGWFAQHDPGAVFAAASPAPLAWLRVYRYAPTEASLSATADQVIGSLRAAWKGGSEPVKDTTVLDGRPSIRVRWQLPLSPDGTGPTTDQTFFFVSVSGGVLAFVLGTMDATQPLAALDDIVATIRLL